MVSVSNMLVSVSDWSENFTLHIPTFVNYWSFIVFSESFRIVPASWFYYFLHRYSFAIGLWHRSHSCTMWLSQTSPGSVFTNLSLERSLSYSPDFSIFRSIWMKHNFWLAKPYGLANQKLCYIQSYKSLRKRQRMFLRIVGEYGPWFLLVCSISLLKTLWEKGILLVTSNFSFSHIVFCPFRWVVEGGRVSPKGVLCNTEAALVLIGFPKQVLVFTCLQYKPFENTVGKGDIACNKQFLLFPQCFLSF